MKRLQTILVATIFLASCRERYEPPNIVATGPYLVVEGNIDPVGPTTILLSKTQGLETRSGNRPENNAQVSVEGRDNSVRALSPGASGSYSSPGLGLKIGDEYRLKIRTSDGRQYVSQYVTAKRTPDIDSINYTIDANKGLTIFANTKDVTGNSKYYRWSYEETWELRSQYFSDYIYEGSGIRMRNFPQEGVYACWKYQNSSSIILANSERLTNDIIYQAPLLTIPPESEKLGVLYSIFVRQFVLDREAYRFYELMKRNTEELGSIFSPQPTEVRGNISNVNNPDEYVLGYVTSSTVSQQRIFIQIPWGFTMECENKVVPNIKDSVDFYFKTFSYIPYSFDLFKNEYYGSNAHCVDCTRRGGATAKPSYWP